MWRDRLSSGKRIIGTMVRMICRPGIAQIAKNSGLDFIMLDMEHGPFSLETVDSMFQLSRALELGSFVRVPELSKGYVSRIMDCGAEGVMVPMIESVDQAKKLVKWTKFAPLGDRGLGSTGGHTDFHSISGDAPAFMKKSNEETFSIAQIETVAAVEGIDAIAGMEGIDVLLVGPNDLSISLGCPGDVMGDEVSRAIEKIADAAGRHDKIFGLHSGDALLERWIPKGLRLIMSSLDINMLATGMESIHEKYGD